MSSLSDAMFDILLALAKQAPEPSHGYVMIQTIEQLRQGRTMQPGLLYTTLPKMVDMGMVTEVNAPSGSTDKRRRYYQITAQGRQVLMDEAQRRVQHAQTAQAIAGGQS